MLTFNMVKKKLDFAIFCFFHIKSSVVFQLQAINQADPDKFKDDEILKHLAGWSGILAIQRNLQQTKSSKDTEVVGAQARHILILTS